MYVCVCVWYVLMYVICMHRLSFADQISTRTESRFSFSHSLADRLSNLKCTETRSKNYNRLKISIDRRSFKFRHPGEARNITLMIYVRSPVECAYNNLSREIYSFHAAVRESNTIRIYHNLRLGRLNSIHGVILAKGDSCSSIRRTLSRDEINCSF